jgi:hypothetical protein
MTRTLLAIAASLGLAVGALSATSTAADARVSVHVGIYSGYPCCYQPRHLYRAYPYRVYPYVAPRHLVCYTVLKKKVYWRHHRKHKVLVPVRVCRSKHNW